MAIVKLDVLNDDHKNSISNFLNVFLSELGRDLRESLVLQNVFSEHGRIGYLYEKNGVFVGFAIVGTPLPPKDPDNITVAEEILQTIYAIQYFGVNSANRKEGVGKDFANELIQQLRNLGARTINLQVDSNNDGARKFWDKVGIKCIHYAHQLNLK